MPENPPLQRFKDGPQLKTRTASKSRRIWELVNDRHELAYGATRSRFVQSHLDLSPIIHPVGRGGSSSFALIPNTGSPEGRVHQSFDPGGVRGLDRPDAVTELKRGQGAAWTDYPEWRRLPSPSSGYWCP